MKKNVGLLFSTVTILALAGCTPNADTTPKDPTVHVNSVSLSAHTATLDVNGVLSLNATINPSDATNKNLTWSVNNQNVSLSATTGASVTVTALVADSTATVTVTSEDGNKTDSCVITVRSAGPVVNYVKAYIHDSKNLIQSVEQKVNNEFVAVTNTGVEDGVTFYNLVLDVQARVKLQANGYITPTGMEINGEDENMDTDGYVNFVANPGDYDFLSLTPKFTDNTPVTGDYRFDIKEASHISLKAYSDEECTHEINGGNQGDKVYLKATSSAEKYFCRDVIISRQTSDTGTIDKSSATKVSDNLFSFTVPYVAYGDKVTIEPVEGNSKMLEGNKAVGSYFTIWLTQATHAINSFETNKNLVISEDGSIVRYNDNGTARESGQVKTFTDSTFYTEDYYTVPYGDKYFLFGNVNTGKIGEPFKTYDVFCIKKENASDPDSDYTVEGERFDLGSTYCTVIRAYHKGNLYANFFLDYTNNKVYEDVDIEVLFGNKINDAETMYIVSLKGEILLSVTYQNDGGYANRIPLVSPYGKYTNGDDVLAIVNNGVAVYKGTRFVAYLSGTTVTLTNSNKKIVIEINTINNTFSVTSDEDIISSIPNMKGLVFTGQYDDDGTPTSLTMTFNEYTGSDDIEVTMQEGSYYAQYWAIFSVTYDLDTNIITMTLTSQKYNWVSIGKTIRAQMSEGQMKIIDQFYTVLDTRNVVLTCSDFHI